MFKPLQLSSKIRRARRKAANVAARKFNLGKLLGEIRYADAQYDLSSANRDEHDGAWKKYDRETIVLHKIASSVIMELLPHFDNNLPEVSSYLGVSKSMIQRWLESSGAMKCMPEGISSERSTPEAQIRRRKIMSYFMQKYPEPFIEIVSDVQERNKHKINVDYLR